MKRTLLFLLLVLLLGSCGNVKDVAVEDVKGLRLKGMTGSKLVLEFQAKVNNPTSHNLYLKKAVFDVLLDGYTFAGAQLAERVEFPKRSSEYQTIQVNVELKDLLGLSKLNMSSLDTNLADFSLSGYAKGGHKLFSRKYKFDNISLSPQEQIYLPEE